MGLLDQVLGQVIGNMAGGGQSRQGGPASLPGGIGDILGQVLGGGRGAPQPGQAPAPAPGGAGGGPLGGALGSILGGAGGKYSPLVLALLAILANKHMSSGAGGLGSILHDMLGGGRGQPGGTGQPGGDEFETVGEPGQDEGAGGYGQEPAGYGGDEGYGQPPDGMGAPPYGGPQGGGMRSRGDGGFLDDVGSMLDGPGGQQRQAGGGPMGGGFEDLQRQFEQNGQGGLMDSWIGSGSNREAAPGDLEQALGSGTIDQLSRQLGIDRGELLDQLSRALPQVVDGLTPDGRAPTPQEQRGWL